VLYLRKIIYSNIINYGFITTALIIMRKLLGQEAYYKSNASLGFDFDKEHGVQTHLIVEKSESDITGKHRQFALDHVPIEPHIALKALHGARIDFSNYHFIDIGSGSGRALILASFLGFKKITGVELSSKLHELAQKNLSLYMSKQQKTKDHYKLLNISALEYQFPDEPFCIYIYRPFDDEIFSQFLEGLQIFIVEHPDIPIVLVSIFTYSRDLYKRYSPSLVLNRDIEVTEPLHCWQVYRSVCEPWQKDAGSSLL